MREASEEAAALAAAAAKTVFGRATAAGNGAVEASAAAEVPDDYVCPISAAVMIDPVSTLDGFTYERKAITEWLRTKNSSPKTGAKLESKTLIPNHSLRSVIRSFAEALAAQPPPAVSPSAPGASERGGRGGRAGAAGAAEAAEAAGAAETARHLAIWPALLHH